MDKNATKDCASKYGDVFIANVIRIIDDRTILVNAGLDILSIGQMIQIYEAGPVIKDLDGKNLGMYYFIKDELEVIHVEKSYSVCQKKKTVAQASISFSLSPLLGTPKTDYIPLNVDKSDIDELKPSEPLVKVGDPIKLA